MADEEDIITTLIKNEIHNRKKKKNPKDVPTTSKCIENNDEHKLLLKEIISKRKNNKYKIKKILDVNKNKPTRAKDNEVKCNVLTKINMPPKEVKKSKQKTISDILQMYNLKNNKTEFCKEKNFNEIKDAYKKSPMYKTEYETKYYPKNVSNTSSIHNLDEKEYSSLLKTNIKKKKKNNKTIEAAPLSNECLSKKVKKCKQQTNSDALKKYNFNVSVCTENLNDANASKSSDDEEYTLLLRQLMKNTRENKKNVSKVATLVNIISPRKIKELKTVDDECKISYSNLDNAVAYKNINKMVQSDDNSDFQILKSSDSDEYELLKTTLGKKKKKKKDKSVIEVSLPKNKISTENTKCKQETISNLYSKNNNHMIKSKENNLIKTELIELSSSMKQHKIKPHNPKEDLNNSVDDEYTKLLKSIIKKKITKKKKNTIETYTKETIPQQESIKQNKETSNDAYIIDTILLQESIKLNPQNLNDINYRQYLINTNAVRNSKEINNINTHINNSDLCCCGICKKSYKYNNTSSSFITHVCAATETSSFKCNICYKIFSERTKFRKHYRIHTKEKPYQCDICEKYFALSYNLEVHYRTHTGEKLYGCNLCGQYFAQSITLIEHYRIHTGEKPSGCNLCGKFFTQSSSLKKHYRIHTGEKSYGCSICGKNFIQSINLTEHYRIHTGEKPYRCDICGKCFSKSTNLKVHNRIHTGERPYQCGVCNKCFKSNSNFNRHMRLIHNKFRL